MIIVIYIFHVCNVRIHIDIITINCGLTFNDVEILKRAANKCLLTEKRRWIVILVQLLIGIIEVFIPILRLVVATRNTLLSFTAVCKNRGLLTLRRSAILFFVF